MALQCKYEHMHLLYSNVCFFICVLLNVCDCLYHLHHTIALVMGCLTATVSLTRTIVAVSDNMAVGDGQSQA